MDLFRVAHGWWRKMAPTKKCYTYPIMMILDTVILCLKNIQKIYKSRDTPLISADISIFSLKSAVSVILRNTGKYCITISNFQNLLTFLES